MADGQGIAPMDLDDEIQGVEIDLARLGHGRLARGAPHEVLDPPILSVARLEPPGDDDVPDGLSRPAPLQGPGQGLPVQAVDDAPGGEEFPQGLFVVEIRRQAQRRLQPSVDDLEGGLREIPTGPDRQALDAAHVGQLPQPLRRGSRGPVAPQKGKEVEKPDGRLRHIEDKALLLTEERHRLRLLKDQSVAHRSPSRAAGDASSSGTPIEAQKRYGAGTGT